MDPPAGADVGGRPRPRDDDLLPFEEVLRLQAGACRVLGSPLSATVLDHVADDVKRGGTSAELFEPWARARFGDFTGLRVLATAHRLVLERRAPRLAVHYPSVGGIAPGDGDTTVIGLALDEVLSEHWQEFRLGMAEVPQTNEPGRSAPLRRVLASVQPTRPIHLREIGASGGLNLLADKNDVASDGLTIDTVISRRGCDVNPIDISTTVGRLKLTSYVWADDVARLERLRGAFEIAAVTPPQVEALDAVDFVRSMRVESNSALVIWHSAVWFYLALDQRRAILSAIDKLGAAANPTSPVIHAGWELPRRGGGRVVNQFALVVCQWSGADDDGVARTWGSGPPHGVPFREQPPQLAPPNA